MYKVCDIGCFDENLAGKCNLTIFMYFMYVNNPFYKPIRKIFFVMQGILFSQFPVVDSILQ